MSKKSERGFTLIELLVIAVIVGILATVVVMAHSGVQAKNRNSERESNIDTIQVEMERYYADNSKYPSLADLNSADWRHKNFQNLPDNALRDPLWNDRIATCTTDKQPTLAAGPTEKCYSYQATTADGSPCQGETACTQYTLTAVFEGGEKYVKTSLN
jgi:prepilin-type N-terminal cleavage/methylation domain-containing protein